MENERRMEEIHRSRICFDWVKRSGQKVSTLSVCVSFLLYHSVSLVRIGLILMHFVDSVWCFLHGLISLLFIADAELWFVHSSIWVARATILHSFALTNAALFTICVHSPVTASFLSTQSLSHSRSRSRSHLTPFLRSHSCRLVECITFENMYVNHLIE